MQNEQAPAGAVVRASLQYALVTLRAVKAEQGKLSHECQNMVDQAIGSAYSAITEAAIEDAKNNPALLAQIQREREAEVIDAEIMGFTVR